MKTLGIVFSNIHDLGLPELTKRRTIASVPVAARYRMVDFVLSDMVNSDISEIGIITKTKYRSLMRHVRYGKDWDLDRKHGGVSIIAPFVDAQSGPLYTNRLEALQNAISYIENSDADLVLCSDCDLLANIPYREIIDDHLRRGADVTIVYKKNTYDQKIDRLSVELTINEEQRLTGVHMHQDSSGTLNQSLNLWVMSRALLLNILRDSMVYGYRSFSREVMPQMVNRYVLMGYEFRGYARSITTLNEYFQANMDVLNSQVRGELFENNNYPIFTRVRDSEPTLYGPEAQAKNSLVSDGCVIRGTVENSILFRGVRVDEGAVVRNCILLNDTIVESDVSMNYVITEKNVVIQRGRNIGGCEGYPFFIGWKQIV